jgi:hypothetical protein
VRHTAWTHRARRLPHRCWSQLTHRSALPSVRLRDPLVERAADLGGEPKKSWVATVGGVVFAVLALHGRGNAIEFTVADLVMVEAKRGPVLLRDGLTGVMHPRHLML